MGASGSPDGGGLRVMVFPTHYALSGGGVTAQGQLYENDSVSFSGYSHRTFSHLLKQIIKPALTPDVWHTVTAP